MKNPNVLILDEPTNDLDIMTLQVLENFLSDFPGCVIIVSHDRYFMDKLVDHLFVIEGGIEIKDFPGNYSRYREWKKLNTDKLPEKKTVNIEKPKADCIGKMGFNEKREFGILEVELEKLEKRINPIFRKTNNSAVQNTALIQKLKVNEEEYPGANQLKSLFLLANFVEKNSFWKAQISQIFVNENGDFELTPRVGGHIIIFGSSANLEGKFENLMTFYKKGLRRTGWNEYSVINLKFKNQVVCTKR